MNEKPSLDTEMAAPQSVPSVSMATEGVAATGSHGASVGNPGAAGSGKKGGRTASKGTSRIEEKRKTLRKLMSVIKGRDLKVAFKRRGL